MVLHLEAGRYFGDPAPALQARGVWITESRYRRGSRIPAHSHENGHFCLILAGGCSERIGHREHERAAPALAWLPPEMPHAEHHRSAGHQILIEVMAPTLDRLGSAARELREPTDVGGGPAMGLAWQLHRELHVADDLSPLAVEALVLDMLVETARATRARREHGPPAWLGEVQEILITSLAAPPGLDELARTVGVHRGHLARVFRRTFGRTVGDEVRRLRVQGARSLLAGTDQPIAAIAAELGFADQAHLTRTFRRLTGETPRRYRDRMR